MKEKIRKILTVDHGVVYGDFPGLIADLETLFNQEVEKRIKERMPSEEEINKQAEQAMQRDTKDGRIGIIIDSTYYGVFCDALEWLRSRLTNPESSQKTEGGEGCR